jgi:hypothetical protein
MKAAVSAAAEARPAEVVDSTQLAEFRGAPLRFGK